MNTPSENWLWLNLGTPSQVNITDRLGSTAVGDSAVVLTQGSDDNIWACYWNGQTVTGWNWLNLGTPAPNVNLTMPLGTIAAGNDPNLLVVGSDGNLWTCYWSGGSPTAWQWLNLGTPAQGVGLQEPVGMTVAGGITYVMIMGSDGNLWTCYWDGQGAQHGWQWYNLGKPAIPGNVTMNVAVLQAGGPANALALASDGNLWTCWQKPA